MKKMMWMGALLLCAAGVGQAQESRQDVSASAYGLFSPSVTGNSGINKQSDIAVGFLGSYRYSVTPRSALELNYSFTQNTEHYRAFYQTNQDNRVHSRMQEISGAYVYSRNYKNFNPFAEIGVGGLIFTPIRDFGTSQLDTRQNTNIGGLFGAGVAYEISPSFDIRAEYRGWVVKTPTFGNDIYKTNRYEVISMPALGVAYHF